MYRKGLLILSIFVLFSLLFSISFSQEEIVLSLDDNPIGFAQGTVGGKGGQVVNVKTEEEFLKYVQDPKTPYIILIDSLITTHTRPVVGSNKTILGTSPKAKIYGYGLNIKNAQNVIVRNLTIYNVYPDKANDAISIDGSKNVWIDHCTLDSRMFVDPNYEDEKDVVDGLCDITNASQNITVSYCIFQNSWKVMLIGSSDSKTGDAVMNVTIHHNIFRNTNSRHPSIRFGTAHIFNNYYQNILLYGVASRMGAKVLVENNYFENVPLPLTTQFESPQDGYIKEVGNTYMGCGDNNITQELEDLSLPYKYTLDPADSVPEILEKTAGAGKKVKL